MSSPGVRNKKSREQAILTLPGKYGGGNACQSLSDSGRVKKVGEQHGQRRGNRKAYVPEE